MAYEHTSPRQTTSVTPYDPFVDRLVDEFFDRARLPDDERAGQIYGRELREALGYEREDLFDEAIAAAMHACAELQLPLREHFEAVFLCDENGRQIARDFRLSRLACYFTTIHAEPINPRVAEAQLFFLRRK